MKARAHPGPARTDAKFARILIAIAEWRPDGIRYVAGERHVKEVAQALGLAEGKAAVTPRARGQERSALGGEELGASYAH